MPLTFEIVALVLFSAMLHAGWNAYLKTSGDRWAVSAVLYGSMALAATWGMFAVAPPGLASWPYLAASIVLHNLYFLTLMLAYRDGDLSQVYPIVRGAAPVVLAALASTVVGDRLGLGQWLAVALISGGVLSLALERRLFETRRITPVLYALLTAGVIGIYTLVDGLGLRRTQSVFGYIFWLTALSGLPFTLVVARLHARRLRSLPARVWAGAIVAGLMAVLSYTAFLWALSLGAMAPVAALRETSVIFAAVIGTLILGEPFGRRRIVAAAVVAAGVVVLNLPL